MQLNQKSQTWFLLRGLWEQKKANACKVGADEDLAGQAKACVDRLLALTSGDGEAPLAADRVGGKVLCVQQHPSVQVIDSLALESPLAMLHWVGVGGSYKNWLQSGSL